MSKIWKDVYIIIELNTENILGVYINKSDAETELQNLKYEGIKAIIEQHALHDIKEIIK